MYLCTVLFASLYYSVLKMMILLFTQPFTSFQIFYLQVVETCQNKDILLRTHSHFQIYKCLLLHRTGTIYWLAQRSQGSYPYTNPICMTILTLILTHNPTIYTYTNPYDIKVKNPVASARKLQMLGLIPPFQMLPRMPISWSCLHIVTISACTTSPPCSILLVGTCAACSKFTYEKCYQQAWYESCNIKSNLPQLKSTFSTCMNLILCLLRYSYIVYTCMNVSHSIQAQ